MKKILGLILAGTLAASVFTACGSSSETSETTSASSSEGGYEEINSYLDVNPVEYTASDYVTLGDYSSFTVKIDKDDYEVTDETVKDYLNSMFKAYEYTTYSYLDKDKTETGDTINVDVSFEIDGMDTADDELQEANITLGENYMQLDGFDECLTGKDNYSTQEFTLTFPSDYEIEKYQGKEADFTVVINGIVEVSDMTYDKMTDSWVNDAFGYTSVDEYVADVKSTLESNAETNMKTDVEIDVVDQLLTSSEIKGVPEGLKEVRVAEYKNQYIYKANVQGISMEEYLANNDLTEEEWDEQVSTYIDDAINKELIYMAICENEGITTDTSDYTSYLAGMKDTLSMAESDFEKVYPEDYCKLLFKEQCALDILYANTKVIDK